MAPPGSPWCEFTVVMFLGPCTRGVGQGPVALMNSDMVEARDLARGFCRGGCCRAVGTTVPGSGAAGKPAPGQRPDLWDVSLEYGQLEESGGGLGMETTTPGLTQAECSPVWTWTICYLSRWGPRLGPHSGKWSSGVAAVRISGCFLRAITCMADAV